MTDCTVLYNFLWLTKGSEGQESLAYVPESIMGGAKLPDHQGTSATILDPGPKNHEKEAILEDRHAPL